MLNRIIIRISIVVVILVGISSYALFESRKLIGGPEVMITEPTNGTTTNIPVTTIKGKVQNINHISMNDRNISIDENGVFQEKFVLSNGDNIIKIAAEDRFGRKTEKFVEILYTGQQGQPLVRNTVRSEYQ